MMRMSANAMLVKVTTMGRIRPKVRPPSRVVERPAKSAPQRRADRLPDRMAANVTQRVKYIFYRKEAFFLRRAITLKTGRSGSFWIYCYNPLGITAYGRTKLEALSAFAMELSSAWHWIAQESDEALAPDALALKGKLTKLIRIRPLREVLSEFDQNH
jgi:hypothetical protein